MATQVHNYDGNNNNHLYKRTYLGNGRYYQRGICKGIKEGDIFDSFTSRGRTLIVDKVISIRDSRGCFKNKENAIQSLYEVELTESGFDNVGFRPLSDI